MKKLAFASILLSGMVLEAETVYFKARLESAKGGSEALIFRVYDKLGGKKLFQEKQNVAVAETGWFRAMIGSETKGGIPESMSGAVKVMVEFSRAESPGMVVEAREVQLKRDPVQPLRAVTACSKCSTCGGAWPIFSGDTHQSFTDNIQRGTACSGGLALRTDTFPNLCCD
jgi:hypothetical protein